MQVRYKWGQEEMSLSKTPRFTEAELESLRLWSMPDVSGVEAPKEPEPVELMEPEPEHEPTPILTVDEIEWINHLTNSTLANHSLHHFAASELSIDNFTINVDLNQKKLAKYKSFKNYFAFPFGRPEIDFDAQHVDLLKKRNYEYIFSADGKLNKLPLENRSTLSRVNFSPTDCMKSDFWWATNKNTLLRRS